MSAGGTRPDIRSTLAAAAPETQRVFRAAVLCNPAVIHARRTLLLTEDQVFAHVLTLIESGNVRMVWDPDGERIGLEIVSLQL